MDAQMDGRVKNILLGEKSIHLWTENYKCIHERDTSRWMMWHREIKEIWYVQGTDKQLGVIAKNVQQNDRERDWDAKRNYIT